MNKKETRGEAMHTLNVRISMFGAALVTSFVPKDLLTIAARMEQARALGDAFGMSDEQISKCFKTAQERVEKRMISAEEIPDIAMDLMIGFNRGDWADAKL